jgi:hypothetical protein
MTVFGRLGYRYEAYLIDGNSPTYNAMLNPQKLPSEQTEGPTIGAALAIPRLTPKIGVKLALDLMPGASVKQTTDLDDGLKPSATIYMVDAEVVYHWRPMMDFQAAYMPSLGSYNFGMPDPASMRGHTGTDVTRTDIYNTIVFGFAKGF